MIRLQYLGWVRDAKGKVLSRPVKQISNAITSFVTADKYVAEDGLAPTAPHIQVIYE